MQFLEVKAIGGADGPADRVLEPRLVLIGAEWRRGQEVSTTRPGAEVSLRLRLEGRNVNIREETYEAFTPGEKVRWRQVRIPLDGFGEQEVEAHWSVLGAEEEEEVVCAVGEISLVQPVDRGKVVLLITSDTLASGQPEACSGTLGNPAWRRSSLHAAHPGTNQRQAAGRTS